MPFIPKSVNAFFKNRKLQVDILTVFLSLITFSCLFIITFIYSKNYKAILEHSQGTIRRSTAIISEKFNCVVSSMQQLSESGSGLFLNVIDFSLENKELVSYMLEVIRYYPDVYAFYVGTETGKYLAAGNVAYADQTHYFTDPSKPLPSGTKYSINYVDLQGKAPVELWIYLNDNLETLGKEEIPSDHYDPRTRPWYLGAKISRRFYWTDVYSYQPQNIPGITAAKPIINAADEIIAVVGVDLTLNRISEFLGQQEIGILGKAFILNFSGDIMVAPKNSEFSAINKDIVTTVFDKFLTTHENYFMFNHKELTYLASVTPFPVSFAQQWYITIIVPFLDYFGDMLRHQHWVLIISMLILIFSGMLVALFSKHISRPIVQLAEEVDKVKNLNFEGEIKIKSNIKEINLMTSSVNALKAAIRSFSLYVPQEIVSQLIRKGEAIALEGEKKEITIFFLEIQDFTTMTEKLSIEQLMHSLSAYFDGLSKIILECQGTIDKYMGEKLMAFWGAPLDVPDHAAKACMAALRCHYFDIVFNKRQMGQPAFHAHMGIHEGNVIVGNIGTFERMNYTVMGESVNIASRLKDLGSTFHSAIVISEKMHQMVADKFLTRPLDFLLINGGTEKVKIYELMASIEGEHSLIATQHQIDLAASFTQAYELYHLGKLPEAKALFEAMHQKFPEDYPTQLYLKRLS